MSDHLGRILSDLLQQETELIAGRVRATRLGISARSRFDAQEGTMNDNPPKATEKLTAIEPGTVWDVQGRGYVLVSTSLDTGTLKITLELVPLSTFQTGDRQ